MKRNIFMMLLVISITASLMPTAVLAAYSPPSNFGAPEGLAVSYYEAHEGNYMGFYATVTASSNLRAFVDDVWADNSAFSSAGYSLADMALQLDFKTDDGSWHADSDWDSNYTDYKSSIRIQKGVYTTDTTYGVDQLRQIGPNENVPDNTAYFDTHTWQFRARFMVVSQDQSGTYYTALSSWSEPVSFSNNKTVEDPDSLIKHTPVLKTAEVRTYSDGRPYLRVVSAPPQEDVTHLNAITSNSLNTEVWLKVGTDEWKLCYAEGSFTEQFDVDAISGYFGSQTDYTSAVYQAKMRYKFDYAHYPEAGKSGIIYSPFSNIISHGLPAYSIASDWAKSELDKADANGLIPASLKGADMTKPITREEFADLAVVLYEKTTGKSTEAVALNPFKDTANPQILKAYNLGIVKGISVDKFAPKELTNREQVATMLSRAIRVMVLGGDFSAAGAPTFTDQKNISDWALEHALFMAKMGIINGADGKFMPKAVTTAEKASGYATTTREQALAMSTRIYEKYK